MLLHVFVPSFAGYAESAVEEQSVQQSVQQSDAHEQACSAPKYTVKQRHASTMNSAVSCPLVGRFGCLAEVDSLDVVSHGRNEDAA